MKRKTWAVIYLAASLPYFLIPSPLDRVFLAAYVTAVIVSFWFLQSSPTTRLIGATERYIGAMIGFLFLGLICGSILPAVGALNGDVSKYLAVFWLLFSMIPVMLSPFSLSMMGERIRKGGVEAFGGVNEMQSAFDHFALDFSLQRWFHHGDFTLVVLAFLSVYYWGWSLLGLPLLLYSVSLLVLIAIIQRSLARRLLAPFAPTEIVERMESAYPRGKSNLLSAGPRTTVVSIVVLSFLAIASLTPNPFVGSNFLLFLGLAVANAIYLMIYLATGRRPSSKTS